MNERSFSTTRVESPPRVVRKISFGLCFSPRRSEVKPFGTVRTASTWPEESWCSAWAAGIRTSFTSFALSKSCWRSKVCLPTTITLGSPSGATSATRGRSPA